MIVAGGWPNATWAPACGSLRARRTVTSQRLRPDDYPAQARDHRGRARPSTKEPCGRGRTSLIALAGAAVQSLGSTLAVEGRVPPHQHPALSSTILETSDLLRAMWALLARMIAARLLGTVQLETDEVTLSRQFASIAALCWACAAALTVVSSAPEGPSRKCAGRWGRPGGSMVRTGVITTLLCLAPVTPATDLRPTDCVGDGPPTLAPSFSRASSAFRR